MPGKIPTKKDRRQSNTIEDTKDSYMKILKNREAMNKNFRKSIVVSDMEA